MHRCLGEDFYLVDSFGNAGEIECMGSALQGKTAYLFTGRVVQDGQRTILRRRDNKPPVHNRIRIDRYIVSRTGET